LRFPHAFPFAFTAAKLTTVAYLHTVLDDPDVLAQDGLAPSEGNPQFHQQMAYAVAMTTIRNFEREANLLATLDHPSIPRIYDYFTYNVRSYLIEEFVDGKDLELFLRKRRLFPRGAGDRLGGGAV
jgi:serine/threonine protein kinase